MSKAKIHFFGMDDEEPQIRKLDCFNAEVSVHLCLTQACQDYPQAVILATYDLSDNSTSEIYISSNQDSIVYDLFESVSGVGNEFIEGLTDIYIQIYPTWEDAYKVALQMRETEPNCYN